MPVGLLLGGAALAGLAFKRISDASEEQERQREITARASQIDQEFLSKIQEDLKPEKEKNRDRSSGLKLLSQLKQLSSLPKNERKPQIEQLSQQFEQMTGKPIAGNAIKVLSSGDSERIGSLLDTVISSVGDNPNFGIKSLTEALTNPNRFMAVLTNASKATEKRLSAEATGNGREDQSAPQQTLSSLVTALRDVQDRRDSVLRRMAFAQDALIKSPTEGQRDKYSGILTNLGSQLAGLNSQFEQLQGMAFSGPEKLSPGQQLVAGGGFGEDRRVIAENLRQQAPQVAIRQDLRNRQETAFSGAVGKQLGEFSAGIFVKAQEEAQEGFKTMSKTRRIRELSKSVDMGTEAGIRMMVSKISDIFGIDPGKLGIGDLGSAQGLESVLTQLAVQLTVPLAGSISNTDLQLIRESAGTIKTSKAGLNKIMDTIDSAIKINQKFARELVNFRKKDPDLSGISEFVLDFQSRNPLFTDKQREQIQSRKPSFSEINVPQDLMNMSVEQLRAMEAQLTQ